MWSGFIIYTVRILYYEYVNNLIIPSYTINIFCFKSNRNHKNDF